jgi:hypothetical protein
MKRISTSIAALLLVCAVSAATASAKVKSRVYGIGQDFRIAGTTLKAGNYTFRFDDKTNELTVTDAKTKQVVAKAEAHAEEWGEKDAGALGVRLAGDAAPLSFEGVAFDTKQVVRISASAAQQK